MPKLVVNPGSPAAWEIQLKPGVNLLGRGPANDFKLTDPSVSGSHCQIVVTEQSTVLRDLGSTNGTFVNRAPVREAVLQPGQTIHLGAVALVYAADKPVVIRVTKTDPATVRLPSPAGAVLAPAVAAAPPVAVLAGPPPVVVAPPVAPAAVATAATPSQPCKFHPRNPGRFLCPQCGRYFCELCVTTRTAEGASRKFCRSCGVECVPVQVPVRRPGGEEGFLARLPGAFAYPLRGSGLLVLIAGTLIFGALDALSGGSSYGLIPRAFGWGLAIQVIALGYLFAYLQNIIHAAAADEQEMPPLPGMGDLWQDLLLPGLKFIGLTLFCFAPAIAAAWYAIANEESSMVPLLLSTFILGVLYFPMAFLSVAILDSVLAANPLQVVPAICKAPLEYLVTLCLLGAVLGVRWLGDLLVRGLFPRGLATHSMSRLFEYFAAEAFWALASLYLLTVAMHILGLLYLTRKEKFGWLTR